VDHNTETQEQLRLDVAKYLARKIPLSPEQRYIAPKLLMQPLISESCYVICNELRELCGILLITTG
jgi:hypothetical protein